MTEKFTRDYNILCDRTLKKKTYLELSIKYKISCQRTRQIVEKMLSMFKTIQQRRNTYLKIIRWNEIEMGGCATNKKKT